MKNKRSKSGKKINYGEFADCLVVNKEKTNYDIKYFEDDHTNSNDFKKKSDVLLVPKQFSSNLEIFGKILINSFEIF